MNDSRPPLEVIRDALLEFQGHARDSEHGYFCKIADKALAALAKVESAKPVSYAPEEMPLEFLDYILNNYPPATVISDPSWHAPRIWSAVRRAILGKNP